MVEENNWSENRHWFALYTKPRNEFKAAAQINSLNLQSYLPVYHKIKDWSDRHKSITEPVLRGYIFVYVNEKERIAALKQASIIRCVSDLGHPAKIPEWQIENLKIMLNSGNVLTIVDGITPGTEVEILEGPFKGIIGRIVSGEKEKMIAVSINLLNRTIIAHLSKDSRIQIMHKPEKL